jgi:hypothetical protein
MCTHDGKEINVMLSGYCARCRFPWWWHTKLAFLLWLQLPTFQVGVGLQG